MRGFLVRASFSMALVMSVMSCSDPVGAPLACSPPCLHGGVCEDPDLNLCDCTGTGHTGPACELPDSQDFSYCLPECENGGLCIAPNTCDCTGTGYQGSHCQTPEGGEEFVCDPACLNDGVCIAPNTCDCNETGYQGSHCQTIEGGLEPVCVPECVNGVCIEGDVCLCSAGYDGERCESPICVPACLNGGDCIAPNSCDCAGTGFGGSHCQTWEGEEFICEPGCEIGGICTEGNVCGCLPGFEGERCQYPRCAPESSQTFFQETWWLAADAHIGSHRADEQNALPNLQAAIADVNALAISQKAIMLGDFVHDSPAHLADYEMAMNRLNHSWIDIIGNHDFDRYGTGSRVKERTFFSKNIAGVRFIALSDDGRWNGGNVIEGYQTETNLRQDQNDWFRAELDSDPGKPTVLLTHQGLWRYYENLTDDGPCFWDTNRRGWLQDNWDHYNIPMWFRGHNHTWRLNENYQGLGVVDVSPGATVLDAGGGIFLTLKRENGTTTMTLRFRNHTGSWRAVAGHSEYVVEIITAIHDWHDLNNVRNNLNGNYLLMNDLNEDTPGYSDYNSGSGWEPIGNLSNSFTGSFDGQEYTIQGLTIDRTASRVGLFGYAQNAFISNLGLRNVNMATTDSRIGALVGDMDHTLLSKCYSTGEISTTGQYNAGGLVGRAGGRSIITKSWSSANVLHDWSDGVGSNAGGLVGRTGDSAQLSQTFATGDVAGNANVGGLVGRSGGEDENTDISASYARGNVSGSGSRVGGLVGRNYGGVSNAYSTGSASGSGSVGGLVGIDESTGLVTASFWDTLSSGLTNSSAGTGQTTDQLKTQSTFTSAGWDFTSVWGLDALTNNGYPFLPASKLLIVEIKDWNDLHAVRDNPSWYYVLVNSLDEGTPGYLEYNSGAGWEPIGTDADRFIGSFDGQGFTIGGLQSHRDAQMGLFGYTQGAKITNLGLLNVMMSTSVSQAGALVGLAVDTTVSNCYSTGHISSAGRYNAGGLLGRAGGRSLVTQSWSSVRVTHDWSDGSGANTGGLVGRIGEHTQMVQTFAAGDVAGNANVGGLVGRSGGADENTDISASYARGSVFGSGARIGGLVGRNYGTISDAYSTGSASGEGSVGGLVGANQSGARVNGGFWDTQTSGLTSSSGGLGRTTDQMNSQSTFIPAGWNFTSYWRMDTALNGGYPHLLPCYPGSE